MLNALLPLLQDGPPDTTNAMLLGYGLIALVAVVYIITLALRHRNLVRDLTVLDQIEE